MRHAYAATYDVRDVCTCSGSGNVILESAPLPHDEMALLRPGLPYGLAKVCGHWITRNYCESHDLGPVTGIPVTPTARRYVRRLQGHPYGGADRRRQQDELGSDKPDAARDVVTLGSGRASPPWEALLSFDAQYIFVAEIHPLGGDTANAKTVSGGIPLALAAGFVAETSHLKTEFSHDPAPKPCESSVACPGSLA